jgi:4-hydroxybenzoate polyprenyltransferase
MLSDHQKSVIRYWEWRRLIFNAVLLADAWFGWWISNMLTTGVDEMPAARLTDPGVIWRFIVAFAILNLGFCIGYAFDFSIGHPKKFWPRPFRSILFIVICVSAIVLGGSHSGRIAKEAAYTKVGALGYGASAKP